MTIPVTTVESFTCQGLIDNKECEGDGTVAKKGYYCGPCVAAIGPGEWEEE